ncbi:MAG: TonB-dependent receptor, partial [Cellvibrionaceae bacterium]|nr:TonB-dependent receptor [Cellvibrionaceae bacterium]
DSYGDDTTYRAAINWQVNDWLRLRGTQGTSFRAPALYEQFLGDETGFANGQVDPCLNYTSVYEPGDTVYDNCAAVVPANFGENGSKGILTRTGGSDTLKAETSESYTYGFIIQPAELGLSVAVNWFDIRIENTVSSLSATGLLGACYSSVNFSSPFCSRIGARDQDGFISEIDSSFINVGVAESSGYDVDFAFEKAFNSWDLLIDGTITYIDEYNTEILGSVSNYEDHFAFPHWRGDMDIQANYKEWLVNWRIDYFGTTDEGPVYDPGTTNVDRVSSTKYQMYHTLAVSWEDDEHWEAVFTIRNIFDRDPPLVADGTGTVTANRFLNTLPGAGYPLYGRTFSLQARYKF